MSNRELKLGVEFRTKIDSRHERRGLSPLGQARQVAETAASPGLRQEVAKRSIKLRIEELESRVC
jgi:hypothetical protein